MSESGLISCNLIGYMMLNLDAIIVLASMTYILGSDYYELHPMNEENFSNFFIQRESVIIVYVIIS